MGNFLLVSCLEAFSGYLSSFFKLDHTILSCSLSVYHIFIFQFLFLLLLIFLSLHLPPHPQLDTRREFLHHVICSSIWVLQRNVLLSSDGKIWCRQYVPPKQWGSVHQILLSEPQKFLSSGFSFYTLQCFSGVISLWMSVVFHPCLYSICQYEHVVICKYIFFLLVSTSYFYSMPLIVDILDVTVKYWTDSWVRISILFSFSPLMSICGAVLYFGDNWTVM
jgi:hypothetical protein